MRNAHATSEKWTVLLDLRDLYEYELIGKTDCLSRLHPSEGFHLKITYIVCDFFQNRNSYIVGYTYYVKENI